MQTDSNAKQAAEAIQNSDGELIVFTDARVKSDGRLTIPKESRERRDIEPGDYVDVILVTDDE